MTVVDRTRTVTGMLLGSERRLGLWIFPLFLLVALLGVTLAGSLAVLWYGQQVSELRANTAGARAELEEAVHNVETTAGEARAAIEEQVRQAREALAQGVPITTPNEAGVYAVSAAHPGGEVRVGSAFTIYSDATETYFVTNYRVVASGGGRALPSADIFLPSQTLAGTVHGYDRDTDLAVLVVRGGPLPVLPWRAAEQPVTRGDVIFLAGVAGTDAAAVVEGRVAAVSPETVVPRVLLNEFVSGGPLVDADGRVVAISSLDYLPFGPVRGDLRYAVPIRTLCRELVRCTAQDLGATPGTGGGPPQSAQQPRERAPARHAVAPVPSTPPPPPTPTPEYTPYTPPPEPTREPTPEPTSGPTPEPSPTASG